MAARKGRHGWTVESICQDLRRRILVQGFIGDQVPGEHALVRHYGVSHRKARLAVEQLINEGLLIREPNRPCRVRPGAAAVLAHRSLLTKIVLVVSHVRTSSYPFAHHVANGANRRAEVMGIEFRMRRLTREENRAKADVIRAAEPARDTTGWILIHPSLTIAILEDWLLQRVPFVVADQVPVVLRVNAVAFDSEEAVGLAAEHLIELGHRRLGCIGAMRPDPVSEGRRRGFRAALEKQDLPIRHDWMLNDIREPPGADAVNVSYEMARELLSQPDRPTGIVCFNHRVGNEVLTAARDLGIDVPGELSVIAAGTSYTPNLPRPELTHVDEGRPEQLGELAVDLLCRPDATVSLIPLRVRGHLVERTSAASPPCA